MKTKFTKVKSEETADINGILTSAFLRYIKLDQQVLYNLLDNVVRLNHKVGVTPFDEIMDMVMDRIGDTSVFDSEIWPKQEQFLREIVHIQYQTIKTRHKKRGQS